MKRISLIFLFTLVFGSIVLAQDDKQHPIDQKLDDCMGTQEGQTTYGMIDCLQKATDEWDSELNKVYKDLMAKLNEGQKAKLRASQRIWIQYRDTEYAFSGDLYGSMDGSMYRVMAVDNSTSFIRSRVMELQGYLDVLSDFEY